MQVEQLIVTDINEEVVQAALDVGFPAQLGDIMVQNGSLVSPANCFGWMDGGIDAVYSAAYPDLQAMVQEEIATIYGGEMLVGQAFVIDGFDTLHPNFVIAPTMRLPATFLPGTVNVYLAMRAIMRINISGMLLLPGLGTASGGMPAPLAMRQIRAAVDDHLEPKTFDSWPEAKEYERWLAGYTE